MKGTRVKGIVGIALLMLAGYSQASLAASCTQNSNNLNGLVGLDSGAGNIYASIISTPNECGCRHVRFAPANTDTKSALSILLAAKMANKKVRIDLLDKTNCDTAYRVYIQ